MKIKKFESYSEEDFNYNYGGHAFVLARYKKGWNNINNIFKNDEFVPCLVHGSRLSKYDNLSISVFGHQYSFPIDNFEILEGSHVEIKKLINNPNLFKNITNFNL